MKQATGRLTLWGIEAFLRTAEEGSISVAARHLNSSPSAISQQISTLEAVLGATLMDRSTRPVVLTPAGVMFRKRAQVILSETQQARAEMAAHDLSSLTNFRLGMIEDFDADVTPRLLAGMAEDLKSCKFLLETGASHRLFDLLDARALDMVVAADTGATADWMEVHPLMVEPFIVAAPAGAVDAGQEILPQLQEMPLIQYTQRHQMGRLIAEHLARQNLMLSHQFELDSYHAIMAMVASGAGWTILTPLGYLHTQRFHAQTVTLPLPFQPLQRGISLNARQGVLQNMPKQVAGLLKPLLQERVVTPALLRMPWLEGTLRVMSG